MGDLVLSGRLNFTGMLNLSGDGGVVKVDGNEVLVELAPLSGDAQGTGVPVILPPPPAPPVDTGTDAWIFKSFNATVTAANVPIVTLGMCLQGNTAIWPGMVLPSAANPTVTINDLPINVKTDKGITLPNGGPVNFTGASGQ